jgi:glycine cleavage system H lipoate-binding protein/ferredoxin
MPLVNIKIDNKEVKAKQGEPILNPIRDSGIDIPSLCHLDELEPYGACRLCIVEVKRGERTRLVTACNYPVAEGLDIYTNTDRVLKNRKMLAELLLARCPDVKEVQGLAASLGVARSRFKTIGTATDCVLCGRCVRVCNEIVGAKALGFIGRGNQRIVGTPWYLDTNACIACGVCTYVCPTGAIQMEAKTTEYWRKQMPGDERICRYACMGIISYKACPNNFECSKCEVDQHLFEQFGTHPMLVEAPGQRGQPEQAGQFYLVRDRVYTHGHLWIKLVRDRVYLGVDDFAQKLIGRTTGMNLKVQPGSSVKPGDPAVDIISNDRRVTMLFPFGGTILHKNTTVENEPSLINDDCYGRGWLYVMDAGDYYLCLHEFISRDRATKWLKDQEKRLIGLIESSDKSDGKALTKEGGLIDGFAGKLKQEHWKQLREELLNGK